jgi:hypothetical protein
MLLPSFQIYLTFCLLYYGRYHKFYKTPDNNSGDLAVLFHYISQYALVQR